VSARVPVTNAEAAKRIRAWCEKGSASAFSWPTDSCGYTQHLRFVKHRNASWPEYVTEAQPTFEQFALDYAARLERGEFGPDPTDVLP